MNTRGFLLGFVLVACSHKPVEVSSTEAPPEAGGAGGTGGIVTSPSSSSTAGAGGTGGMGGSRGGGGEAPDAEPPHPYPCAAINPGFTCVEDNDCPPLTKEQVAACGLWSCVVVNQPNPDAGIPPKMGCIFLTKPKP